MFTFALIIPLVKQNKTKATSLKIFPKNAENGHLEANLMTDLNTSKIHRSSRLEVFCKNVFAKFIGKHLCWSLFFNKVAGLQALKKRLQHR